MGVICQARVYCGPRRSWGVAPRSSGAKLWARSLGHAAAAIMAALSVDRASEGKAMGRLRRAGSAWSRGGGAPVGGAPPRAKQLWGARAFGPGERRAAVV